jgi:hypothetical protein
MKTAVETVFIGKDRLYNRRFLQMCSHYLIEPVVCTPAFGWEKGHRRLRPSGSSSGTPSWRCHKDCRGGPSSRRDGGRRGDRDRPEPRTAIRGQMKPEQLEIARLKREVIKLKAERDILKKPRPNSRRSRREVRLHREAPGDLDRGVDVRGARCLASRVLCLAETATQRAQPDRRSALDQGAGELHRERSDLRRQARVARRSGRGRDLRPASDRAIDAAAGA